MVKVGDEVIILQPFWCLGENLGDRLGRVVSIKSHVLVDLYQHHSNPVKCFQRDVKKVASKPDEDDIFFNQIFLAED